MAPEPSSVILLFVFVAVGDGDHSVSPTPEGVASDWIKGICRREAWGRPKAANRSERVSSFKSESSNSGGGDSIGGSLRRAAGSCSQRFPNSEKASFGETSMISRKLRKLLRRISNRSARRQPHRRLMQEPLEDRRLLSLAGVTPTFPLMTYDQTGVLTYDPSSHQLDITATPISFKQSSSGPARAVGDGHDLEIHILVDNSGAFLAGNGGRQRSADHGLASTSTATARSIPASRARCLRPRPASSASRKPASPTIRFPLYAHRRHLAAVLFRQGHRHHRLQRRIDLQRQRSRRRLPGQLPRRRQGQLRLPSPRC